MAVAQVCPRSDWKKQYGKAEKVKARIVYVDPVSKQIKLSLQPELVDLTIRNLPALGQVFEVVLTSFLKLLVYNTFVCIAPSTLSSSQPLLCCCCIAVLLCCCVVVLLCCCVVSCACMPSAI